VLRSFVAKLLSVFFLFAIIVLFILIIHHVFASGLIGETLRHAYEDFRKIVILNLSQAALLLTAAGPILGVVVTLISGAWAIHKTLYYANKNLPNRLVEYLNAHDKRLLEALPARIDGMGSPYDIGIARKSVANSVNFKKLLKQYRFKSIETMIAENNLTMELLVERIKVSDRNALSLKQEKLSAMILLGAGAAALANKCDASSSGIAERRKFDDRALGHFQEATRIDVSSLEANELLARHMMHMGHSLSLGQLQRFCAVAEAAQNHAKHARGLRLIAELYEHSGIAARLRQDAKPSIQQAIELLNSCPDETSDVLLEKARAWEADGRIRETLKQTVKPLQSYHQALSYYERCDSKIFREKISVLNRNYVIQIQMVTLPNKKAAVAASAQFRHAERTDSNCTRERVETLSEKSAVACSTKCSIDRRQAPARDAHQDKPAAPAKAVTSIIR
jgi:tetratricopeptide (TPR) repeat protein